MEENDLKQFLRKIYVNTLMAAKNVLTFEEVVLYTGMSKSHLYKLTCSHQIPHYKPNGKLIYFDRVEVETWLKQNRVATDEEVQERAATYVVTSQIKKGGVL